jgi:uncharacterized repeat protein (TIGR04076 family)
MAREPGVGHRITAVILSVKGHCHAGHKVGDTFAISCHDTAGLCGFFYHSIFPYLSVLQFGGAYPWGEPDSMELECPDYANAVKIRLTRDKRKTAGL